MKIGYPDMARQPYEDAVKQFSLNFQYYKDLAKCYKALGLVSSKITEYRNGDNPLNKVMLGILKDEQGARHYLDDLKKIKISINGDDLQKLGINPSPKYQQIFDEILKQKLKNPNMTKDDEINIINH